MSANPDGLAQHEAGVASHAAQATVRPALLRSKLSPPTLPAPMIARTRWARWIDRILSHRTCLISAPAGHGKTTFAALMVQEAQARGLRAAWVSFSRDDNEAAAVAYLLRAVGLDGDGAPPTAPPRGWAALRLSNAIHDFAEPFLLVLDDVDTIDNPDVVACLDALIDQPPANLTLLLTGRRKPVVALGPAERAGTLLAIEADQLAFTDTDAMALFGAERARVSAAQAATFNRELGGWPAGLKAAAARVHGHATGPAVMADWLGDYFTIRLGKVDPGVLAGLRCAAVSPAFDQDLCLALSGDATVYPFVTALADAGCFVDVQPGVPGWHRLHAALRGWLLHGLSAEETRKGHLRAAAWHHERGRGEDAIDHAIAGGDDALATDIISGLGMAMVERSAVDRLGAWLDRLPQDGAAGNDELRTVQAWSRLFNARDGEGGDLGDHGALEILRAGFVEDDLARAMVAAEDWLERPGTGDFVERMIRALVAHGAVRRGQFALVQDVTRPLLIHARRSGPDFAFALAVAAKGAAFRAQGQLGEAERILRSAASDVVGQPLSEAVIGAALSRCRYECGAFDEAATLADAALPVLERSCFQRAYCQALTVAIRCAALDGRIDDAADFAEQAEILAFERNWTALKALSVVERARLGLPHNVDPEAVVPADGEAALAEEPLSSVARAFALLSEARAYEAIMNDDRPRLTAVAAHLLQLAANADDMEQRTRATLFNILPQLSGRCDKMVDIETVRFLNHAASSGFQRTIVDVLDVTGVRAVQNFSSEAYSSGSFLALLKLADPSRRDRRLEGHSTMAPGEGFSFLTEREIEILSALNTGESNKEIARALKLTPETVKWHLKNIMHKLRAKSRDEAVQNALALGLKLTDDQRH